MYYRPWLLIVIAVLHIVEPVTKVLYFALIQGKSPAQIVVDQINTGNPLHIIPFFFLFPLAGIAIYAVKKWSLPLFLFVELWVLIANFSQIGTLFAQGHIIHVMSILGFTLINVSVVCYLMIPAVRIAYTDPRLRWWEAFPRYSVEWKCTLNDNKKCKILNISEGGIFLSSEKPVHQNQLVRLSFKAYDNTFEPDGFVVHAFNFDGKDGVGIEFRNLTHETKAALLRLLTRLEQDKVPRRPEKRKILESFIHWAVSVPQGKGILPEPTTIAQRKIRKSRRRRKTG